MGEVGTFGDLLSRHYLQISDITNTNYWLEDRVSDIYRLVLNNYTCNTGNKSNGITQNTIYMGCVLLERLKQSQDNRDFWNTRFSIVNIHDGKNRILSLYHLLYLLRSMIKFETESEQIRLRYLELDFSHEPREIKLKPTHEKYSIVTDSNFTNESYDMGIVCDSEDDNSDCEMDLSINDPYSSFTSCPRVTFEDQTQNNILAVGLRSIMHSKHYKTTLTIHDSNSNSEFTCSLTYQRAATKIKNDIISLRINPSDLWKYLIDKIVFHICYVPITSVTGETIIPQFYRNQAFTVSKGVIEMIGMQIIHTDISLVNSRDTITFTNVTTIYEPNHKDNNRYYNDILFSVMCANNISGSTPESDWKRLLRILYSSTGLSRDEYNISSSIQSNILYISSKFLCSTLDRSRDRSMTNDQDFMDLFLVSIPIEIDKLDVSPSLSRLGHTVDSLLKNYLVNILLTAVESYLFIEGIVGETDQISMNPTCKLTRFSLHTRIKPISILLKLLNYTKMYYIFTPVLMAFFCNPVLSTNTSASIIDKDKMTPDSLVLFDNLNRLVCALLKFWLAQQFVRIYSKIEIVEYQSAEAKVQYCDVTTQKFRQVLIDFSRQVYSVDVSLTKDVEQKPLVAMKRLINVISNYIQQILPKESNIIRRVCCSKTFSFTTWSHTKFLLYLYELQSFGDKFTLDDLSSTSGCLVSVPDYDKLSVEHILPKSSAGNDTTQHSTYFNGYSIVTVDRVHKLGNLSIADCKANSHYSNFGYKTKSNYKAPGTFSYANSSLFSLKEIVIKYSQWDDNSIDHRSHLLACYFDKFIHDNS